MTHLKENKKPWISISAAVSIFALLMTALPTDIKGVIFYIPFAGLLCILSGIFIFHSGIPEVKKFNRRDIVLCISISAVIAAILIQNSYESWRLSGKIAKIASGLGLSVQVLLSAAYTVCAICGIFGIGILLLAVMYDRSQYRRAAAIGIVGFYIMTGTQIMMYTTPFSQGVYKAFLGLIIIEILISMIESITGSFTFSACAGSLIPVIFATIDHYVYRFRGSELKPLDFMSAETALNVVSEYNLSAPLFVGLLWIGWVLLVFWLIRSHHTNIRHIRRNSFLLAAVSVLVLWVLIRDIVPRGWSNQGSSVNGTLLNFVIEVKNSFVEKPDGYQNSNLLSDLENKYDSETESIEKQLPSIIVIMDESFTDYDSYQNEVNTETELIPYIRSLKDNVIRGYAYSSVFGGNTANSEFEFLTGNTMAYLPAGSVAYQQYVYGSQYSLLTFLHQLNYTCIATHPYRSSGWNRPNAYKALGFDETTFYEDYPQEDYVREYISDREMFDYVIETYENRDRDKNFFLFGISMQNHGGYTDPDFESTVDLEYEKEYPVAEQFLSLTQLTDQAVENLIHYFEKSDEPVVICFFGDHQPAVETRFLEELNGSAFDDINEETEKYKIPFFVWANYDIEEKTDAVTSINYLSNDVLDAAGIELPAYNRFLKELSEEIPVINSMGYYSVENDRFIQISDAAGKERELLTQYRFLEYNNLFDKKHLSRIFDF